MRSLTIIDATVEYPIMVTITRGAETLRWNSSAEDVTISGDTWVAAPGAKLSSLQFSSNGQETNADVLIHARVGGPVEPGDAARGLLDGWPITVEAFDASDPAGSAVELVPGATIGSASEDTNGMVSIAVSGQLVKAGVYVTEHYAMRGREDLGDDRCKIPIMPDDIGRGVTFQTSSTLPLLSVNDAYGRMRTDTTDTPVDYANVYYECTVAGTTDGTTAPAYDPTPGNTTVDGTATFTARNAWTRYCTGQASDTFEITLDFLPDPRATDPTWYVLGAVYIRSGALQDYPKIPIRAWDPSTLTVTLFLPVSEDDIPASTQLEIHTGCDLTRDMCFSRFNNIINLRAETFVPPPGSVF